MSISTSSSPILKPSIANMFGFNENKKKVISDKSNDIFEYSDSFEISHETSNETSNELLDFELERELECEKELDTLPKEKTKSSKPNSIISSTKNERCILEIPPESYFALGSYLMEQYFKQSQS